MVTPLSAELVELRDAIARHLGKSGFVRPVGDPPDHDRAWQHMLAEADALLRETGIAVTLDATRASAGSLDVERLARAECFDGQRDGSGACAHHRSLASRHAAEYAALAAQPTPPLDARTPYGVVPAGCRLILASEDVLDQWGTRTERGERITVEWGEPSPEGWYEPTFTVQPDWRHGSPHTHNATGEIEWLDATRASAGSLDVELLAAAFQAEIGGPVSAYARERATELAAEYERLARLPDTP